MTVMLDTTNRGHSATLASSRHRLRPAVSVRTVASDRAVLFAGHAECPSCGAYVRRLSLLGADSLAGELVAGWCSVCCTITQFRVVDDAA